MVVAMRDSNSRHSSALRRIPATHALALRLRAAGLSDELIADCLGIERVSVGPLLIVAQAKLAAALGEEGDLSALPEM